MTSGRPATDEEKITLVRKLLENAVKENQRIIDDMFDKFWDDWLKEDQKEQTNGS